MDPPLRSQLNTLLSLLNNSIAGLNLTEVEYLLEAVQSPKYKTVLTVDDLVKIHYQLNQSASQVFKENPSLRNWFHDKAIKISNHLIADESDNDAEKNS